MISVDTIAQSLSAGFPAYHFSVYRGLFEKYIAVEIQGEILFTIWVDKKSGYKELLDEVNFTRIDWLKRKLKSRLFHWSKYRRLGVKGNLHENILRKLELSLRLRTKAREELELSLQNMHIH